MKQLSQVIALCLFSFQLSAQLQKGSDLVGSGNFHDFGEEVAISENGERIAIAAPNASYVRVFENVDEEWQLIGQQLNGQTISEKFGTSIALSADGNRIAIGAPFWNSNFGVVRIYEYNVQNNEWIQMGETIFGDTYQGYLGSTITFSADGLRLAVGGHCLSLTSVDGPGYARVYQFGSGEWFQIGEEISGVFDRDFFSQSISLSGDGNILAVGAPAQWISSEHSFVRTYELFGNSWQLQGEILADNPSGWMGSSVGLSFDGTKLVVGDPRGEPGIPYSNNNVGEVKSYEWVNNDWEQLGDDLHGQVNWNYFGDAVSISSDGNRIAAGAPALIGSLGKGSYANLFEWSDTAWIQLGEPIKSEHPYEYIGSSIALSGDGKTVALGSPGFDGYDGSVVNFGLARIFEVTPNVVSTDSCFTIKPAPYKEKFILEGDFSNCNIFVLDANENVVQFLLNIQNKIEIDCSTLPDGLHFVRIEHQQHEGLFYQEIIKIE